MEKVKTIIQTFLFLMLVGVWSISETIYGQTRQVGDLYTFDDGTQGVVFYVDADNPNSGWVVALNDMDTVYALHSNGYLPTSLLGYAQDFPYSTTLDSWNYYGKNVTQSLKNTGNPNWVAAVNAVGSDWYIPDAMQMRLIYGLFPMLENAFEAAGGDYSALLQQDHWTSSVPPYQRSLLVFHADGTVESYALNQSFAIRLIRDYEDQPIAFWADAPRNNVMEVSPPTTSDYDALIVYLSDTVVITKEVEVYETFEKDTIYEQTEVSEIPYTSPTDALFSNIDVSVPGDYVFHSRMNTMHGCDSVITLMLRVDNHTYYADSLCSLHEDYYFAPFDTLFRPGTISGRYEHHGSKVTDNEFANDYNSAFFQTDSGIVVRMTASFINNCVGGHHSYHVYGTKGYFEHIPSKGEGHPACTVFSSTVSDEMKKMTQLPVDFSPYTSEFGKRFESKASNSGHGGADVFLMQWFMEALRSGAKEAPITLRDGLRMTIPGIYAAESVIQGGKTLTIRYPWDDGFEEEAKKYSKTYTN